MMTSCRTTRLSDALRAESLVERPMLFPRGWTRHKFRPGPAVWRERLLVVVPLDVTAHLPHPFKRTGRLSGLFHDGRQQEVIDKVEHPALVGTAGGDRRAAVWRCQLIRNRIGLDEFEKRTMMKAVLVGHSTPLEN